MNVRIGHHLDGGQEKESEGRIVSRNRREKKRGSLKQGIVLGQSASNFFRLEEDTKSLPQ